MIAWSVGLTAGTRILRRTLLPRFPGLPSRGHAVLVILFLGVNLVVSFVHMDNNNLGIQTNLAARWGWCVPMSTASLIHWNCWRGVSY